MNFSRYSLLLFFLLIFPQGALSSDTGRVIGRIQVEGVDTYRGVASLWDVASGKIPDPRRYIVIPSAMAALDADGSFELQAAPGIYYLGAIVRQTPGPPLGPPRPGDQVFLSPGGEGEYFKVQVRAGETLDVGTRSGGWRYDGFAPEADLAIRGTVRDTAGEPVADLLVFAFADPSMSLQPVGVSDRTDAQGHYLLRLDRPQPVFLRVRESYGGGPLMGGGYVGVYGGAEPRAVALPEQGIVEDIDIEVIKLPPAGSEERRPMRPAQSPADDAKN